MIRRLRARHRAAFLGLALLLPAGVAAALAARDPVPAMADVPGAAPRGAWTPLAEGGEPGLRARLVDAADGSRALDVLPATDLARPDLLLYVTRARTDGAEEGDVLPDDAVLLGALSGAQPRRFALPPDLAAEGAALVLYSLAHAEVVGRAPFPTGRERD